MQMILFQRELSIDDVRRTVEHPQIFHGGGVFLYISVDFATRAVGSWASPSWDNHVRWKRTANKEPTAPNYRIQNADYPIQNGDLK